MKSRSFNTGEKSHKDFDLFHGFFSTCSLNKVIFLYDSSDGSYNGAKVFNESLIKYG